MAVITISRQLGAGGGEIGRRVAGKLGYALVNRETLTEAAEKYGLLKTEELASIDEIKPRFLESIFGARRTDYFDILSAAVYDSAAKGKVVIVGGGAQIFLKDVPGVLHVRVTSSLNRRVKNIAQRYKVDGEKALKIVRDSDRNRAHFFKTVFDADWNHPDYYDIVLRADKLDVEMAAGIIVQASKVKELEASWEVSQSMLIKLSLASRIRVAFRAEKYGNLSNIKVNVTPQGYIHLTGYVSSEDEKDRAEKVVRSIEGVVDVINELTFMQFTPPVAPY